MEQILRNIIENIIIPKFGHLNYSIKIGDCVLEEDGSCYIMEYYGIPKSVNKVELNNETKIILKMLGLKVNNLIGLKDKKILYYIKKIV